MTFANYVIVVRNREMGKIGKHLFDSKTIGPNLKQIERQIQYFESILFSNT